MQNFKFTQLIKFNFSTNQFFIMFKMFLSIILFMFLTTLNAQVTRVPQKQNNTRREIREGLDEERVHSGFYLSMCLGLGESKLTLSNSFNRGSENGFGAMVDFKIGGAIAPNTILHGSLLSSAGATSDPRVTTGLALYAAGVTQYFMPHNIGISGSIGAGFNSISQNGAQSRSDWGWGFQVKVLKEWYVSKKWGLGLSLQIASVFATAPSSSSSSIDTAGLFYGVGFNATLN
jgi:hypothetical protein